MGNQQSQARHVAEQRSQLHHPAQLSIIIPTLNEQSCISQAILSTEVRGSASQPEVIVVDGGSKDCTRTVAASHARVHVVSVPEGGRGLQLNAGTLPQEDVSLYRQQLLLGIGSAAVHTPRYTPACDRPSLCVHMAERAIPCSLLSLVRVHMAGTYGFV